MRRSERRRISWDSSDEREVMGLSVLILARVSEMDKGCFFGEGDIGDLEGGKEFLYAYTS